MIVVCAGCAPALTARESVRASIAGGKRGVHAVTLSRGQSARVILDQRLVDLVLTITPSSGVPWTIDMRERGQESATLVADAPARFEVAVSARSAEQEPAEYEIRLEAEPRPVSERDRQQHTAERLESEAKALATGLSPSPGRAYDAAKQALALWRGLEAPLGTATTLARMGDILRAGNRAHESHAAYVEALTLFQALGNRHQVALIENNIGVALESRGQLVEARGHFRAALEILASLPGAEADVAAIHANEGAMLIQYGDYEAALERLQAALPMLERHRRLGAPVLNLVAVAYRGLGDLESSERYFTRALAALSAGDQRAPRLRLRLAEVALHRGDIPLAESTAREALSAIRATSARAAEPDALTFLGEVEAAAGRLDAALAAQREALSLFRAREARRGMATALHHIGVTNRKIGDSAAAAAALAQALQMRREIGLRDAVAETLYELGVLAAGTGDLERARTYLGEAIGAMEAVRGRVTGEYSRALYLASRQKYFAALIDVLMQMHDRVSSSRYAAEAFEVAERERARSLIDVLRESGTDLRPGVDPAVLDARRDEQRQLDFWASRVAALTNQKGPDAARQAAAALAQMNEHLTAYRAIDGRIRAALPRTASPPVPPTFTIAEVRRRLLRADTRLLRFTLGERRSHAWLVAPGSLTVVTLPARAEVERLARDVVELVRTRPDGSDRSGFFRAADALATLLLAPFARSLAGHRLLIVCDGILQQVPFAALPEPGTRDPLVVRHEIAMLPSATAVLVHRQQRARRDPPAKTLAVVADAVYEEDDPRLAPLKPLPAPAPGESFSDEDAVDAPRLFLARNEGEWALGKVAPEQRFSAFDFDASADVLSRLGGYRIVHLATHAIVDDLRPELSAVILSKYDATGRRRRGLLRLHALTTELDLNAEIVVLSACSSVDGRDVPGEGLMGLTRGFIAAGAASVIGSLTVVEEEPTFELMKGIYDELFGSERLRPAAALRRAQLRLMSRQRFRDPYFWSAFVFIGDPR